MQNLDPTYLRYIYDNLIKGSVNPDNDSELPDGLIGLYEEAFEEHIPVLQRQQLLQRFALFALLKKEVSAVFVAEVLGESEAVILEFINTYASWFNSPEPEKFQLYHERLKVYVLQKLSEKEILTIHEKLISRLELAILQQKADEFEMYALEFLSYHYYVEGIHSSDGQKLLDLAYDQSHWQRQLKISKGYTWTKNGLKAVMSWASKYNEDEVIECGLQMVDLNHQEQNAAPQILALVAEGDFESALIRIEQFGSNDNDGLRRRFILYILCLIELIILDSKDKPNSNFGSEKILKHLNENTVIDYSMLNWDSFFSSITIYRLVLELKKRNIYGGSIFLYTKDWDSNWIQHKNIEVEFDIELLLNLANYNRTKRQKDLCYKRIASYLIYQNNISLGKKILNDISDPEIAASLSLEICSKTKDSKDFKLLNDCIFLITNSNERISFIIKRTKLLISLKRENENDLIRECETEIEKNPSQEFKCKHFLELSLISENTIEIKRILRKLLIYAEEIKSKYWIKKVITSLVEIKKSELIYETIEFIANPYLRAYAHFQFGLATFDKRDQKSINQLITNPLVQIEYFLKKQDSKEQGNNILSLATQLIDIGMIEEGFRLFDKCKSITYRDATLVEFSGKLTKINQIDIAINCAKKISNKYEQSNAYLEICLSLYNLGKLKQLKDFYQKLEAIDKQIITCLLVEKVLCKEKNDSFWGFIQLIGDISLKYESAEVYLKRQNGWEISNKYIKIIFLLLEKKTDKKLNFDSFLSALTLDSIGNSQNQLSLKIWSKMSQSVFKDMALRDLIFKIAETNINESIKLLVSIDDSYRKFATAIDLYWKCKSIKSKEGTTRSLKIALELLKSLDVAIIESSILDLIIVLLDDCKLSKAKALATSIKDLQILYSVKVYFAINEFKTTALFNLIKFKNKIEQELINLDDRSLGMNCLYEVYNILIKKGYSDIISMSDINQLNDNARKKIFLNLAEIAIRKKDYIEFNRLLKLINDNKLVNICIKENSKIMGSHGICQENILLLNSLTNTSDCDSAKLNFVIGLCENYYLEEAINLSKTIINPILYNQTLKLIILSCQENHLFSKAIEISNSIKLKQEFNDAWEGLGKKLILKVNFNNIWENLLYFKDVKVDSQILYGVLMNMNVFSFNQQIIKNILCLYSSESNILFLSLQKYFLKLILDENFKSPNNSKFVELLKLQWAIDLKKELDQLPN